MIQGRLGDSGVLSSGSRLWSRFGQETAKTQALRKAAIKQVSSLEQDEVTDWTK